MTVMEAGKYTREGVIFMLEGDMRMLVWYVMLCSTILCYTVLCCDVTCCDLDDVMWWDEI